MTTFKAGDQVKCLASRGYNLTEGKTYTVIKYEPPVPEEGIGFTWPAYLWVMDDNGKPACCHATRFEHTIDPMGRKGGSLYDRGAADSYYRRGPDPHYGGTIINAVSYPRVPVTDPVQVAEYMAGFDQNEAERNFKDYE